MKNLASPWLRIIAYFIDLLIFVSFYMLIFVWISSSTTVFELMDNLLNFVILGVVIFPALYGFLNCYLTATFGGSLGKLAMGIKVVDKEGKHLSLGKVLLRNYVGYVVSSVFLWAGFFWVFVDHDRQTWHDQIAESYVTSESPVLSVLGFALAVLLLLGNFVLLGQVVTGFSGNQNLYREMFQEFFESSKDKTNKGIDQELKR